MVAKFRKKGKKVSGLITLVERSMQYDVNLVWTIAHKWLKYSLPHCYFNCCLFHRGQLPLNVPQLVCTDLFGAFSSANWRLDE